MTMYALINFVVVTNIVVDSSTRYRFFGKEVA